MTEPYVNQTHRLITIQNLQTQMAALNYQVIIRVFLPLI
jgi:hypothetical protein